MRDFEQYYTDIVIYLLHISEYSLCELSSMTKTDIVHFMGLKARLEKPTLEDIYLIQHASGISDEQLEEIANKIRNNQS